MSSRFILAAFILGVCSTGCSEAPFPTLSIEHDAGPAPSPNFDRRSDHYFFGFGMMGTIVVDEATGEKTVEFPDGTTLPLEVARRQDQELWRAEHGAIEPAVEAAMRDLPADRVLRVGIVVAVMIPLESEWPDQLERIREHQRRVASALSAAEPELVGTGLDVTGRGRYMPVVNGTATVADVRRIGHLEFVSRVYLYDAAVAAVPAASEPN